METNEQSAPKSPMTQEPSSAPSSAKAMEDKKAMEDRDMLKEIYENTRKAKTYMMWQLYITLILVVLPLLAAVIVVPMVMRSLASSYGSLLQ